MAAKEAKARIKINKLLDETGKPLLVLEAKSEDKNPLVGKKLALLLPKPIRVPLTAFRSPERR
ncbi:hypothetical protein [Propionivibrio limicola]|uniref:hypothetical protein n=1 Tax=Propionivibrio limicola TaxID=167645 RepID=UPI0012929A34|nr:hypothetical protein [Propionivibrio limicola]